MKLLFLAAILALVAVQPVHSLVLITDLLCGVKKLLGQNPGGPCAPVEGTTTTTTDLTTLLDRPTTDPEMQNCNSCSLDGLYADTDVVTYSYEYGEVEGCTFAKITCESDGQDLKWQFTYVDGSTESEASPRPNFNEIFLVCNNDGEYVHFENRRVVKKIECLIV